MSAASAVFVIGYSAYDLDIARILYADPSLTGRLFFIETVDIDPILKRELEQYGVVLDIGIEKFASLVGTHFKRGGSPTKLVSLDAIEVPMQAEAATGDDVLDLLLYGRFDSAKDAGHSIGGKPYAVNRSIERSILDRIKLGGKVLFLHSDLGNGKSIIMDRVGTALTRDGYSVFRLGDNDEVLSRDLEYVSRSGKEVVILVDDVFRRGRDISLIRQIYPDFTIISASRSAIYELRSYRLSEIFNSEFLVFDCNKITQEDAVDFVKLFDDNGLWGAFSSRNDKEKLSFILRECGSEIRNLLLFLFESPSINRKIVEAFGRAPDGDRLKAVCVTLLLDLADFHPDIMLIGQLTGIDIYLERSKLNNEFSMEFISFQHGNVNVKSAIFSEYVLQNVMNIDFLIDLIISVIKSCEKGRVISSIYSDLQKELMRFSFIDRVFKRKRIGNRYKDIYDGIKELPSMARNPQFWLQYAIARLENGAFGAAEIHFRTAYSHASRRRGYDTFQIDNHFARFLLESRINDPSYLDDFKAFIDAHALLSKQAKKEKDAYYPYKVARNYRRYFEARGAKYDADQRETVRRSCLEIVDLSDGISKGVNKYFVIDECRLELLELIRVLDAMRVR